MSMNIELPDWLDACRPDDALYALMVVLAIDAEKCSRD